MKKLMKNIGLCGLYYVVLKGLAQVFKPATN